MKITCPFCKVEYSVKDGGARGFQCAVCGCVWRAPATNGKNSKMWIFILSCFVLALAIFSAVALLRMPTKSSAPLIAIMESASQSGDALVVSGKVENKSEKLYGVPDLVVMIKGDKDAELASMKFAPPVPLLDAGESARFSVVVPSIPVGIKKISVELDSQ